MSPLQEGLLPSSELASQPLPPDPYRNIQCLLPSPGTAILFTPLEWTRKHRVTFQVKSRRHGAAAVPELTLLMESVSPGPGLQDMSRQRDQVTFLSTGISPFR